MEVEEILGEFEPKPRQGLEHKRETLKSVVFGGGKYVDHPMDKLCDMTDEEIDAEYEKYQRRIGAVMVKTIGKTLLTLYSNIVSYFVNIEDTARLIEELDEDPFIDHAMNKTCCELYHKYGMYLAPLTTIITTAKYCNFKDKKIYNIITEHGDEQSGTRNNPEPGNGNS